MPAKHNGRPFVGRRDEIAKLQTLLTKKSSSLVTVKGRRRIGKSRLIEEFAKGSVFLEFSGLSPEEAQDITAQQQRNHFSTQLSLLTNLPDLKVDDWNKLFILLSREINDQNTIVLFDEISWMGSKDPTFLAKLKTAWDIYFKKKNKLILILCGSVSSWIEKNILRSKLFMGRVSLALTLSELSIADCNQLMEKLGCKFSNLEKFYLISILGGIPRYLEELISHLPAEENIKNLCFSPSGILVHEFEDIFTDIFSKRNQTYKQIVSLLSNESLDAKEINQKLNLAQGSYLSECLEDLCLAGLISRHRTWKIETGKESRLSRYRLKDNYIRFYLKYIEPNLSKISEGHFANISLSTLPGWTSIMGLQFENLVINNRKYILAKLNISRENIVMDNPFFQRKTVRWPGCQVDYLIQTKQNTLYFCEIKFSKHAIKSTIIDEMRNKISQLKTPKGYAILPVLIHINGIDEAVEDSDYFYKIIDFSKLLLDSDEVRD